MSKTYDIPEIHALIIGHESDAMPILDAGYFGPFESVEDAQKYARAWREKNNLPSASIVPTAEENEEWTDKGYTFAIFQLTTDEHVERIANPSKEV